MGRAPNAQRELTKNKYLNSVTHVQELTWNRIFTPWEWTDIGFELFGQKKKHDHHIKILHDYANEIIKQRRSTRKIEMAKEGEAAKSKETKNEEDDIFLTSKKRLAMLDILLKAEEDGASITDYELRSQVNTFVFAGHDTSSTSMGFLSWLLATNPDCMHKVQNELDEVFGRDGGEAPCYGPQLAKLQYLEACAKVTIKPF